MQVVKCKSFTPLHCEYNLAQINKGKTHDLSYLSVIKLPAKHDIANNILQYDLQ